MLSTHHIKKVAGTALLSGGLTLIGFGLASGTAQAFNPQPEPPTKPVTVGHPQFTNPGVIHGFNPQPDPPGLPVAGGIRGCDGSV
ncbi:hypothetical protein EB75_10535 [Mycobacterium sp. ST-F2]|uniref:hypothetical protein n=1 Tax=Mycobacterium sp. ST-F2 TaxID=1490484 RepID=UPI00093F978E|nr:hypothetical protein [Mycobacterium sp. ST-F2]OKH83166.1 hypothetical protein EB75_10535 [Mycobacterium sp. ST-F2]